MIEQTTIEQALIALGFTTGWAASESDGILLWENDEPQPTDDELRNAGWVPA